MEINHNLSQLEGKNNIKSHAERVGGAPRTSASSTHVVSQGQQQRQALKTLKQVQGDFINNATRGLEGKRAFTLIELLVVVLIIGILASVALPQYQKAVAKSRLVAKFNMMRFLAMEEEAYFLENNTYARSYAELGVRDPSDDEWDFFLDMSVPNIELKNKKDSQVYLRFFLQNYSTESSLVNSYKGKWLCLAGKNNELQTSICQSMSGKSEKKQYLFMSNYWEFPLN